jgi:hypothetical protein
LIGLVDRFAILEQHTQLNRRPPRALSQGVCSAMPVDSQFNGSEVRPSQVIAEALVNRYGPKQIVDRAKSLGCSQRLTTAMVVACTATAVDNGRFVQKEPVAAS